MKPSILRVRRIRHRLDAVDVFNIVRPFSADGSEPTEEPADGVGGTGSILRQMLIVEGESQKEIVRIEVCREQKLELLPSRPKV